MPARVFGKPISLTKPSVAPINVNTAASVIKGTSSILNRAPGVRTNPAPCAVSFCARPAWRFQAPGNFPDNNKSTGQFELHRVSLR